MWLHNDEPTLIDWLNRADLVQEVGRAVAYCDPPQVFGIHGDWGAGKTSFLHQLQLHLTGKCPQYTEDELKDAHVKTTLPIGQYKYITVIWFEAWRYQYETVPVVALLQEIRSQLEWSAKLKLQAKKIFEVTFRSALLALEDLTKKIGIQASKIQEVGEKWERDHLAAALPSHTIREHLQKAIDDLLPEDEADSKDKADRRSPRLVVLIDDLDRCEAESAYKLLEGLKIYLTLRNCVFVLGLNQKIIEDVIRKNMPGEKKQDLRAAAYLEKLCQNFWRLPVMIDPKKLLCQWLPNEIKDLVEQAIGDKQCLPPNPRRLKGFANLLRRFASLLPQVEEEKQNNVLMEKEIKYMLVVAYIYQFHHDLFLRWQSNPDLYNQIRDWIHNYTTDLDFLKQLELPLKIIKIETTATPEFDIISAYPDPTESNIFWIQRLIHEFDDTVNEGHFMRYLAR